MDMSVWDVIVAVLKNKYVIIAVVAVVLYLNFVNYIISYRKRPKPPKQKKLLNHLQLLKMNLAKQKRRAMKMEEMLLIDFSLDMTF